MTRMFGFPTQDDGREPARDERLGALLRDAVGEPAMSEMNWRTLADRVGASVRAQQAAPWWSHVARWQRRALPLALAAGVVGALALWNSSLNARDAAAGYGSDAVTAVISGTSSAEAAHAYAGAITNAVDLAAGVPE